MIKPTYYVYEHYRRDTGQVFYVGKGTSKVRDDYRRAFDFCRRKRSWKALTVKYGVSALVVAEFFREEDALAFEAERIAAHGRRDIGRGPLVNHTDGGKGASGYRMSDECKAKIAASNKGRRLPAESRARISAALSGERHWKFGTVESDVTRAKKAASMRGKNMTGYSVVDRSTGQVFASICEAARHLEIPHRTLTNYLRGDRRNKTTMELA